MRAARTSRSRTPPSSAASAPSSSTTGFVRSLSRNSSKVRRLLRRRRTATRVLRTWSGSSPARRPASCSFIWATEEPIERAVSPLMVTASGCSSEASLSACSAMVAGGPVDGQLLEGDLRVDPLLGGHLAPAAIRTELPGEDVVGQCQRQHLVEPGAQLGVLHRHHRLHPAVEVAVHHVGRAQVVVDPALVVAEAEEARVL